MIVHQDCVRGTSFKITSQSNVLVMQPVYLRAGNQFPRSWHGVVHRYLDVRSVLRDLVVTVRRASVWKAGCDLNDELLRLGFERKYLNALDRCQRLDDFEARV